jgi:chromosome segregation ATPase
MTTEQRLDTIDHRLEIITEQIGRLTESPTKFRADMAEIKEIIKANSAQIAEVSVQINQVNTQISHLTDGMTAFRADMAEIKETVREQSRTSQQQAESVARLSRIVEQLLGTKGL